MHPGRDRQLAICVGGRAEESLLQNCRRGRSGELGLRVSGSVRFGSGIRNACGSIPRILRLDSEHVGIVRVLVWSPKVRRFKMRVFHNHNRFSGSLLVSGRFFGAVAFGVGVKSSKLAFQAIRPSKGSVQDICFPGPSSLDEHIWN